MHEHPGSLEDSIPEYYHSKKPYGISLGFSSDPWFCVGSSPAMKGGHVVLLQASRNGCMSISQAGGQQRWDQCPVNQQIAPGP
ncbi:uncharacterized [Tachysurus ichikawai]